MYLGFSSLLFIASQQYAPSIMTIIIQIRNINENIIPATSPSKYDDIVVIAIATTTDTKNLSYRSRYMYPSPTSKKDSMADMNLDLDSFVVFCCVLTVLL